MDIKIAVATHKKYPIPEDTMYLPVQAGSALNPPLGYAADNTGSHISQKNENYCELTVLYWAWKNLDAEYIGLCHYRRHFGGQRFGRKQARILTQIQAANLLSKADILLPKPRNYWIETNYSQYAHAHHACDLDSARAVTAELFPEYLESFDLVMGRTWGHRFNMLVAHRDVLNQYCSWLFAILEELEARIEVSGYSSYDRRVMGFLAERLLDVWLEKQDLRIRELPVVNLESQHWPRKIAAFLRRKFRTKH